MKIAIVQASLLWEDVEGNLEAFGRRLRLIEDADVIVLPEMFSSGFTMEGKEKVALYYERICQWMTERAREKDALIMGTTVFRAGECYYNRCLVAFPTGELLHYDKRHCFTMGGERDHFVAGKDLLVFDYRGVRFAPFICYDLRFPVWSRNTSGYDVAVYMANWPAARREPWQLLLKARAIENQCYVVGVNCVGEDGKGLLYTGDSVVVSPRGEVIGECVPGEDCASVVEIDLEGLQAFREKFPVLEDRDVFEIYTNKMLDKEQ